MKFVRLTERDQSGSNVNQPIWVNPLHVLWFEAWNANAPENGTRVYIAGQELSTWVAETVEEVARLFEAP